MKILSVLLLTVLLASCGQPPAPTPEPGAPPLSHDEAVAEVRAVFDEMVATWNAGDPDAIMAGLADDFVQLQPDTAIVGKAAIDTSWRRFLDNWDDVWTPVVQQVQVADNLGFVTMTFEETSTRKDDGYVRVVRGRGMAIFRRDASGRWMQVLDQWFAD